MLLAALSTGHKIGLGLVALAFIAFALVSSFALPRLRSGFPGKDGTRGFVAVSALFFCAMIAAVWFFGKEPKEASAKGEKPPASVPAPATTVAATTAPATTAAAPAAPKGDAAAGKQLFAAQGCGGCHTYAPAGAGGKVGPDLGNLASDAQKANRGPLDRYAAESISDPGAYVVPGFPNGVMPSFASLGDAKIQDLVAFLTRPG